MPGLTWRNGWGLIPLLAACMLLVGVACGSATPAEPVVVEKEVIKEVEKEVVVEKEVIKEVEKPVVVEKEVIKEVEKEVIKEVFVEATPTPAPVEVALVPDWVKQGKYGGVARMSFCCDPDHFDLHQSCCANGPAAASAYYNQLVEFNPVQTDRVIGDFAQSWDVSPDGLKYTFHLPSNAVWSDGMPITADDVTYSIERMYEEGQPRPRTKIVGPYIKQVSTINPTTVEIEVNWPAPPGFIPSMAVEYMKILPKHVLEAGVDIDNPKNAVTGGPYLHDTWEPGNRYIRIKNPNYFKEGRPFIDEMQIFKMTGKATVIAAYKTEQVLMPTMAATGLDQRSLLEMKAELGPEGSNRLDVYWLPPTTFAAVFLNFTRPPFDDERVRRAIHLATDRQDVLEGYVAGRGLVGSPWIPNTFMSSPSEDISQWPGNRYADGQKDPQDLAEAKRLLAEAGYPDGFKALFVVGPTLKDPVLLLTEQYRRNLGLDIDPNVTGDWPTALAAFASGDYDMGFITHGLNIADPDDICASVYLPGGSRNQLGWEHPKITEGCRAQARESDPQKRREILLEMEEFLREGVGHWIPVYWSQRWVQPVSNRIKNYHPFQTLQNGMKWEHIWLDDPSQFK